MLQGWLLGNAVPNQTRVLDHWHMHVFVAHVICLSPVSLDVPESTQALTSLHGLPPWHCLSPSQKKQKLGCSETNCPIPKPFLVHKSSPPGPHPTRTTMMMVRAMIRHQNMLTPCPMEYLAYQQILMVLTKATVKTGPIITYHYQWGYWVTTSLSNSPKVEQQVRFLTPGLSVPSDHSHFPTLIIPQAYHQLRCQPRVPHLEESSPFWSHITFCPLAQRRINCIFKLFNMSWHSDLHIKICMRLHINIWSSFFFC